MPRDNIVFAAMDSGTVHGVAEVESECFSEPWSENTFRGELSNVNALTLAALDCGRVVGFINIHFVLDEANINNVAVTESFRGQGIAAELVALAEEEMLKKCVSVIHLEVRESNSAAVSLYKKLGFSQDGMRKNFYAKPIENAILMSKEVRK